MIYNSQQKLKVEDESNYWPDISWLT